MSTEEPVFTESNQPDTDENESVLQNTSSSSSSSSEEDNNNNNNYPEVPVSPSSKVKEDSYSPNPTFMQPKDEPPQAPKKEVKRKPNAEYNSFFFFNIWYCFYFRFVCRCDPIRDEDIYDINPDNRTDLVTDRTQKYWEKKFKEYDEERKEYEKEKSSNPDTTRKPPKVPSLISTIIFGTGTYRLIFAVIFIILSYGCLTLQPAMMKETVNAVYMKSYGGEFPYAYAIVLIISPILVAIFDSWGNRYFFNFSASIKCALSGLVYNKTMLLNITSQSNIDVGRLLSLIAADTRNVSEMIWMPFMLSLIPIEVFLPWGFVVADFGWSAIMALVVIAICFPIQLWLTTEISRTIKNYLAHNDERNKVTNETLQGIRVVKFTGLEKVFMEKINVTREKQLVDTKENTWWGQSMQGCVRSMLPIVNLATFGTYVGANHIPQSEFSRKVMANLGFLTQMTRETNMIPMYLQNMMMIAISQERIRDFLLLPELKREVLPEPEDPSVAMSISHGTFQWGDPPEIPLSMEEKQLLKEEAKKRKKEEDKLEAKRKAERSESDDENLFTGGITAHEKQEKVNNESSNSNSNGNDNIIKTSAEHPVEGENENNEKSVEMSVSDISSTENNNSNNDTITSSSAESSSSSSNPLPASSSTLSSSPSPSVSTSTNKAAKPNALTDVSIIFPKGSLTMIIGGVGSGKSSIGAAIIGDIDRLEGEVKTKGDIAYCPQVAWINNNTVRGNIIFGSPFDEEKYLEVVRVCALEPDFRTLSAGDMTAIGEKGVNLSGGQKARIQLARAVYSDRDIYVLDDPLSAVDAHVGRYLFDECILSKLKNKGKTVVLMTNQLQFIDRADNIVILEEGKVFAQGPYSELKEKGVNFDDFIIKKNEKEEEMSGEKKHFEFASADSGKKDGENTGATIKDLEGQNSKAGKQIITEEEYETGSVPLKHYWTYINSLFNPFTMIVYFTLSILAEGILQFMTYWLGVVGDANKISGLSYGWKIGLYGWMTGFVFVLQILRALISGFAVERGNRIIHNRLLKHIIHCPPAFFDTTPMGRILNRFTGDITQTDQLLWMLLIQIVNLFIGLVGQIIVVGVETPIFFAIGAVALFLYIILLMIYGRVSRNMQRLESIARSPVLSIFSETVSGAGLSTIRAFHLEDTWREKFYKANDDWSTKFTLFLEGKAWATLYSQIMTAMFMAGCVLLGWFEMNDSEASVAVTAGMTFGFLGQFMVQQSVELESRMTSYQRLDFYSTSLPQEKSNVSIKPAKTWPEEGKVQFDHVSFRYRPGLPYVLNDVSFTFKGGEKIGVCGRTGAGKSSLLFALFRLVELDPKLMPTMIDIDTGKPVEKKEGEEEEEPNKGRVLIDDIDISKVRLSRVRQSIAIIPQDPTLFTGTLRYNLDLGHKCTDDEIWQVLELIEMKQVVLDLPYQLDTQMAEGGSNFSCGQRQLICFGRAMLNKCRIVVMDEATANVDVETDAKIQKTIKRVFSDKTVIVIAHRLNTIMGSDRIMVMDKGRVSEIDTPANLMANPDSAFNGLIKSLSN